MASPGVSSAKPSPPPAPRLPPRPPPPPPLKTTPPPPPPPAPSLPPRPPPPARVQTPPPWPRPFHDALLTTCVRPTSLTAASSRGSWGGLARVVGAGLGVVVGSRSRRQPGCRR